MFNKWRDNHILHTFTPVTPPICGALTSATNPTLPLALGSNMLERWKSLVVWLPS